MRRASPQSLARAIWKNALLFLLFEQSYCKVTSKPTCASSSLCFLIVHMLHHLLCTVEFEKIDYLNLVKTKHHGFKDGLDIFKLSAV